MKKAVSEPVITNTAEALEVFSAETVMGLDLETSGLHPMQDAIAVVSLYGEKSKRTAVLHVQGTVPPELVTFLSTSRTFIGHNISSFDLPFLVQVGLDLDTPTWFDTLIAESIAITSARKDLRVSLQAAVKRRLGVMLAKEHGLSTWMTNSLTAEQVNYCREDVLYLPRLRTAQLKAMGPEQVRALTLEHTILPTIVRMTVRGLPIDSAILAQYTTDLQTQQDWALAYISNTLGAVNYFSPTQIMTKVREKTGYHLASSGLEGLQRMSEEPGEIGTLGRAFVLVKQMLAQNSGPQGPFWGEEHVFVGRMHPRYRQVDRDYGRISVSEPNLEVIPAGARAMVGGCRGSLIVSATFVNLWWGVMTYLTRDASMRALVEEPLLDRVAELLPQHLPGDEFLDRLECRRRYALACLRSCLFGHPIEKLRYTLRIMGQELEEKDVVVLYQGFKTGFPALARLHAQAVNQSALTSVPVTFPSGMRRTVTRAAPHEIVSLRAKGTAGALMKYTLRDLQTAGLGTYLLAVVGEEVLFEIPEERREDLCLQLTNALRGSAKTVLGFEMGTRMVPGAHWL